MLRTTDYSMIDNVALSAALGTEHYEISAYQTLITSAEAMGATEAQSLLEQNLQQEQHTSDELVSAVRRVTLSRGAGM